MKLKYLSTAMVLATLPATGAFAAALDRSGQSISAFLQPGNYFEAGISVLDPDVSGTTIAGLGSQKTGDMAGDYTFYNAALKLQLTDKVSFGFIYDQPFGADAEYKQTVGFTNAASNTEVEVDTQNITMLFGFQPNKYFNVYAGPAYQTVKGNVHLAGAAYGPLGAAIPLLGYTGYDANIKETSGLGWLAGAAYQIPEIALKASVTYRSEIDHDVIMKEKVPSAAVMAMAPKESTITTPQSVNLDLQSGIMADTVAFANIRWVNWKDFAIKPVKFGVVTTPTSPATAGLNLVDYSDDQWSVNAGVGRKVTDKWAGNVSVGYDTGAGNPVSTLGPTEGYWNAGVGVQYSPTPATFISGGVKYFWLGDAEAKVSSGTVVGKFEDNNAIAYGLKMGYRF